MKKSLETLTLRAASQGVIGFLMVMSTSNPKNRLLISIAVGVLFATCWRPCPCGGNHNDTEH